MFQFRPYQVPIFEMAKPILSFEKHVYLVLEPRLGKTYISYALCDHVNAKDVLYITKIKNIKNALKDHKNGGFKFNVTVTNYEQAHKIDYEFDLIIIDEAHNYGTFPKPSLRYKNLKGIAKKAEYIIWLSATPTPENYSQIFHQLQLSNNSPFKEYKSFYKWAVDYVEKKSKYIGSRSVVDWSGGISKKILPIFDKFRVCYTQEQAGFKFVVKETFINVKMMDSTKKVIDILKRDRIVNGKTGVILADTGGKLFQKIHQLCSGTVKLEDGRAVTIDDTKAQLIPQMSGKLAIYYVFKEEREMLVKVLGDKITEDDQEFQESTDKIYISQVISGREGVKIDTADKLIMFNIGHAYLSYRQTMDRIQDFERDTQPEMVWLFSDFGVERSIYDVVKNTKTNFTYNHYKKIDLKQKQIEAIL